MAKNISGRVAKLEAVKGAEPLYIVLDETDDGEDGEPSTVKAWPTLAELQRAHSGRAVTIIRIVDEEPAAE